MTNFWRLKAHNVEKLTQFLADSIYPCTFCAYKNQLCEIGKDCKKGIKEWLESEEQDD